MNFDLSPEQKLIQDTARDLAAREILPRAAEIDRKHEFPRQIFARLGELGLLGVMVPEKFGGAGMGALSYAVALEEIARACASTAVAMSVQCSLACAPILLDGNDAQRAHWLPDLAARDPLYVLPGMLALSMFGMQWFNMRAVEHTNEQSRMQMKMMMWIMPPFMLLIFLNLPSGLNLYYVVSNLATIPQQIWITKERQKMRARTASAAKA